MMKVDNNNDKKIDVKVESYDEKQVILIVDDQTANLQVLAELVEKANYQAVLALSGKEALEFVSGEMPALILLDIMMPDMDGYEVLERLKSRPETREIPVIFISAKDRDEEEAFGFEKGCADYIAKPFSPGIVLARIKHQIDLGMYKKKLKHHIDQLEESRARLDSVNREKDMLFSIIAHDLKNPFSVVLGLSDLIVKRIDTMENEKVRQYAEKIFESGTRVFRLLENLLEWANMQLGLLKFQPGKVDLHIVASECVDLLAEYAAQKSVDIKMEKMQMDVFADKNMVSTVIRNLINNSIKFSNPNGEIHLSVDKRDNMARVTVEDFGVGIKPEVLSRLFVIKEKVSTIGTKGEIGSGLGLLICKDMVEKNGGKIKIKSDVGSGTKVYVTFPLCEKELG